MTKTGHIVTNLTFFCHRNKANDGIFRFHFDKKLQDLGTTDFNEEDQIQADIEKYIARGAIQTHICAAVRILLPSSGESSQQKSKINTAINTMSSWLYSLLICLSAMYLAHWFFSSCSYARPVQVQPSSSVIAIMGQIGDGKSRFIDDIGGHRIGFELPTTFCRQYNLCKSMGVLKGD